jgi:hypothetical protein
MPKSGVKNVYAHQSGGFFAQVRVDGVQKRCSVRRTIEEAAADVPALLEEQRLAKIARKQRRADDEAEEREQHADELEANMERSGDNCAKDGLSRQFLKLALQDTDCIAVDGVEYSHDVHVCRLMDDLGFDPELDVEFDDDVPTLVIELKSTSCLQKHNGSMDNPKLEFQGIDYADKRAALVVMLYIPKDVEEATQESLTRVKFWYKHAFGWSPKYGKFQPALYGGNDASSRPIPGHLLGEKIAKEVKRIGGLFGLIRYGDRSRYFKSDDHRVGQRAIDAFEAQVLLPQGARFIPPESGLEGDAIDRRIAFSSGDTKATQVKHVYKTEDCAGFFANLKRHRGSYKDGDGNLVCKYRPYHVNDGVELFIFVLLDGDGGVAEYWCATQDDMLGTDQSERLITDADGVRGVRSMRVHPLLEDKERLGDIVENGGQDTTAVRTRAWLKTLGPIEDAAAAKERKANLDAARRALRLSAKAERTSVAAAAATAAAEKAAAAAAAAGPSTVNNHNTFNVTVNNHYATLDSESNKRLRLSGDIRGFFGRK